jgi:hypothetical protein
VNCLDCANDTETGATRPAVGVCVLRGAGVCEGHAGVTTHHLTRVAV